MRVAVDGMGGDHSPSAVVEGCVQALEEFKDIEIYITGPEDLLKEAFSKFKYDKERVVFIDAKEVISTNEHPAMAVKKKKTQVLLKLLDLLRIISVKQLYQLEAQVHF